VSAKEELGTGTNYNDRKRCGFLYLFLFSGGGGVQTNNIPLDCIEQHLL
jgi:hypothetical protein